jgi:hypothetical protein
MTTAYNKLIEYIKIHKISLEQDSAFIEKQMNNYSNYEDDEYRMLEIEDISNTGQIIALEHILAYAKENV